MEPVDPANSRYAEDQLMRAVALPRLTALGISTRRGLHPAKTTGWSIIQGTEGLA
jgi:hypothetical protein